MDLHDSTQSRRASVAGISNEVKLKHLEQPDLCVIDLNMRLTNQLTLARLFRAAHFLNR